MRIIDGYNRAGLLVAVLCACLLVAIGWARKRPPSDCTRMPHGSKVVITDPDLVYIGFGQSNSECYSNATAISPDNAAVLFDNRLYSYTDPMAGSSGTGSCVYGRIAQMLSPRRVVFSTVGCGGKTAAWLLANRIGALKQTIAGMRSRYNGVNAVLYHQGESDVNTPAHVYKATLRAMQAAANVTFVISIATAHCGRGGSAIAEAQRDLASEVGFAAGPNSDAIGPSMRHDGCHFNEQGLTRLARMWTEALA